MLKIVFFISFFLAFSFGSFCQSIGLQNVPPYGSYFVFSEVKSPDQLEHFILTKKLHNNIWDFRGLDSNMEDTSFYINPKSKGLDFIFPEANLTTSWNIDNFGSIFKIDSTGQYQLGYYPFPFVERNEKPVRLLKFPLQLGVNYSDSIIRRYDYSIYEQDTGKVDSACTLIVGRAVGNVISDGIMITITDTIPCILLKLTKTGNRYQQYKEYGKNWVTTITQGPSNDVDYFLFSNSVEPVARIYPLSNSSDTGVYALQYLRKSVLHTSVEKNELTLSYVIYPNPALNLLNVKTNNDAAIHFNVIDLLGKTISSGILEQSKKSIDVTELNNGLYYLALTQDDKTTIYKFIKR